MLLPLPMQEKGRLTTSENAISWQRENPIELLYRKDHQKYERNQDPVRLKDDDGLT